MGQAFANTFDHIVTQTLRVTGDVAVGDDLTVADDLTVSGALVVSDSAAVVGTFGVNGDLNVTDDVVIVDSLTVTGTSALVGNVDVTGNMDVADYLSVSAETYFITGDAYTITEGATITPTQTVVEMTAAGAVSATMAPPSGDGQLAILVNTADQTITLTEDAEARIAGNFAMGQYDTITLVSVGVKWYEVARSNN
jgi:UDP-3-O-[3-hydroxymyristoyl] glucosamine N-acyltransferase